jgi:hypothetical protein
MMNPIETAVLPLRTVAVERATFVAEDRIERMTKEIEAAGWDLDKVAPYPRTDIGRKAYQVAMAKRSMFRMVFSVAPTDRCRKMSEPFILEKNAAYEAKFVDDMARDAAAQYDMFVAKLNEKIGEVASAELFGNHVWDSSKLFVVKAVGSKECWKTQMIINVSKLGKLFNQFPTRKVKG